MQKLYSKNFFSPCPVETTLNLIGNKWKMLIVRDLLQEKRRFGELKKSISATKNQTISQNVLTQNLRELEECWDCETQDLCRSPTKSGVFADAFGREFECCVGKFGAFWQGYIRGICKIKICKIFVTISVKFQNKGARKWRVYCKSGQVA